MDNNNLNNQGQQGTDQGQFQNQNAYQQNPYQQSQYQQQNTYQQQNPYQQNPYQQPYQNSYQPDREVEDPVSFGDWMLTILIMCIPCVNVVMMFVWAFSSNTKKSKSNYFKAQLVWALIYIVVVVLLVIVMGASLGGISELFDTYY